ncbi:ABC transporter ATP-binding protein [Algoriphagus aquaeductus]|uniref:ABC transporter ATP-binding protein n=1 Tax=Algoriphagus aquaeductus TaxID=475299 RepID=UPI000DAF0C0B|nr:ABC transporter ATP-binding protein [Algoriphagus aquaeductus]
MSNSVIKVDQLSKRYRLGLKEKQAETLVGQISQAIRSPWENLKRLRQLSRFGEEDESVFWALKDVSFEVQEGEVLGIIGKNGAGKSTLLKILSQITEPTSGKIEIHGRVASLLEVGTGFHPELSGRENIYMNGTILGMTRREIDSKLDEIIDFSGIEKFIDTPVKFYSSGMKVRLGFSVAAHLDPEILIIDEVLAVGDFEFQKKCLGKMEEVSKNQGRTVLFVSHDLASVANLCKRVLLLEKGKITFDSTPSKTIDYYFNSNGVNGNTKDLTIHPNKQNSKKGLLNYKLLRNGIESDFFYSQDTMFVEFDFFDPSGIEEIVFGLVIKDSNGKALIGINNLNLKKRLNKSNIKEGKIVFELDKIPFYAEGKYYVDLFFGDGGDNYDTIENAFYFNLKPISILEDGNFLSSRYNLVHPGQVNIELINAQKNT